MLAQSAECVFLCRMPPSPIFSTVAGMLNIRRQRLPACEQRHRHRSEVIRGCTEAHCTLG